MLATLKVSLISFPLKNMGLPRSFSSYCTTFFAPNRIHLKTGSTVSIQNCHLLGLQTSCPRFGSIFRFSSSGNELRKRRTTMNYVIAGGIFACAMSFAAVPLYRMFCAAYSYAGTIAVEEAGEKVATMVPAKDKPIRIKFNADVSASMRWNFKPQQREIVVRPGETALAFYTATNPTDVAVTGVSSYNVLPFEAGQHFVKIQCFCFEEQQLNPHEQVDMPVFFYIDPEFMKDPKMEFVDEIILSYTFFEAKDSSKILAMLPEYAKQHLEPKKPNIVVS